MKRVGFAIVVAAVVGCQSDRVLPAPSAQIRDALHNGGSAFFFWTPPVVNQQPPSSQNFSADLSPVITITNLCPGGGVVRTFSGSQISVSNARYHANWRTSEDNLSSGCTYRMTVTVGSEVMGFADLDVVDNGRELRNVNTTEFIPLLDDRTLPIQFFIGTFCQRAGSDCGEGAVDPDQNTTIVTPNGQAGVFVPAGAVSRRITITIESVDERPCFTGLLPPVFPGTPGAIGNSCYDYRTDPPLSEVNEGGRFNTPVIVGICPDAEALELGPPADDLLQIYQFDIIDGAAQIRALNNVRAPFLSCDPGSEGPIGARPSGVLNFAARGFRSLLQPIAALVAPRPLYARSNRLVLDLGTGGETDFFSRFMWALPSDVSINFDQAPDRSPVAAGTLVNTLYSRLGTTFTRTNPEGLCAGTGVYANDHGPGGFGSGQNNITPCPQGIASDFSEAEYGAIQATFTLPAVQACIEATPIGFRGELPGAQAYIEAFDATGASLARTESTPSTAERVAQRLCVSGTGISFVRFAGKEAGFAIFDNFFEARTLPPIQ